MEPRQLGQYQLVECIAHGGMGEVWKALDTQLQRYVAIKVLRSIHQNETTFVARFEHEARLVASLHHPNIVKIHNFHTSLPPESDPPLFYMVMDYVQGQTLLDYIRETSREGRFPDGSAIIALFTSISLALDYAHERGMIHRDIKPANILLDQRMRTELPMGEPVLTDFGIARQQGISGGTIVHSIMGTPLYIAPEQALGNYDDCRSDLYSLGVILYEIMTGKPPFQSDSPMAIVMQHLYEPPPPPFLLNPHISPALSAVILKSIAKEPDARYPTARAMTIALAEAFNIPVPSSLVETETTTHIVSFASPALAMDSTPVRQSNSVPVSPYLHLDSTTSPKTTPAADSLAPAQAGAVRPSQPYVAMEGQGYATPSPVPILPTLPARSYRLAVYKKWAIVLVALLCISGLGYGLLLNLFPARPTSNAKTVSGTINFIKSTSSNTYNALQIDLQNVPPPPAGQLYYGWVDVKGEGISPHWQLSVAQGKIHTAPLTYQGFTSLLVANSLFLITRERADSPPVTPDTDPQARLYYAQITSTTMSTFTVKSCPSPDTSTACIG